jgi:hypothetical protein
MQADALIVAVKTGFYTTDDPFAFTLDDIKLYVSPILACMYHPEILPTLYKGMARSNTMHLSREMISLWVTTSISTRPSSQLSQIPTLELMITTLLLPVK